MTTYKAAYIPLQTHQPEAKPYYRTLTSADTLSDAIRQAERWARKGYICRAVIEERGNP